MEDRPLTDKEKIKLIKTVINSGGLFAVNECLQELYGKKEEITSSQELEVEKNIVPQENLEPEEIKLTEVPKEASIYRHEAIGLVKQDLEEHPIQTEVPIIEEKEIKGPVKKLVNNPWASAEGIKTVSPGQLKL